MQQDDEVEMERPAATAGLGARAVASGSTKKEDAAVPATATEKTAIPQFRRSGRKLTTGSEIGPQQPHRSDKTPLLVPPQLKRVGGTQPVETRSSLSQCAAVGISGTKLKTPKLPGSSSSTSSARSMIGTAEERYAEARKKQGLGPLHLVTGESQCFIPACLNVDSNELAVGQRGAVPSKGMLS